MPVRRQGELALNGRDIVEKQVTAKDKLKAEFEVPFAPGTQVTVAYKNGAEIGRKTLESVGPPAKLHLRAERSRINASSRDLGYVLVEVRDAQGRKVPCAMLSITFSVTGAARLRTTGSANPRGLKSFRSPECTTFHGEALGSVQPGARRGECVVRVSAPGLSGDGLVIVVG